LAARVACCHTALVLAASPLADLLIGPVQAQSPRPQYIAKVWQTEQGLPQNSVNAILQDRKGYLWIGTFGGLARFDGERFTVFSPADTRGFGSARILDVRESRSGDLWIGTVDGGLTRLRDGVAMTYTQRDGLPSDFVSSIREDNDANMWINTARGIARFVGSKLEVYRTHRGKPVSEFFRQERDGSMWFRSGTSVMRFGADGSIASLNQGGGWRVRETRDGSVWLANAEEYLLVRYYRGVFTHVELPPPGRRVSGNFPLLTISNDSAGNVLVIVPAGLIRISDAGIVSAPEPLPWPSDEAVKTRKAIVDREGNLWVGTTASGLVRFRRAPLTAYGSREGLADVGFNAVFQDREGRTWLGGDALYRYDRDGFRLVPGVTNLRAIAQTRDGDLLFGGYGGLQRWRSGVLTRIPIEARVVRAIHEDRGGNLWVGALREDAPGGLYRLDDGKWEQIPGITDVRAIMEDPDGSLWVGGLQGLWHVRDGKAGLYNHEQGLANDAVYDVLRASDGNLWVATYGGGLNRFRDGNFKAITSKEGLPNNMLVRLHEQRGQLWISSNQDIFRLDLKQLNDFLDGRVSSILPVSYGIAEGMRSSESNQGSPAIFETPDGRLWFTTLRGVVAIDPMAGDHAPPTVVLEEALADTLTLTPNGKTSVPPGHNTLDFRYTTLSFSAPEKVRFKYRLEPYDTTWVDAGTRRSVRYTNMAPGNYSFRVIAANSNGIWTQTGAGTHFTLRPRFFQTIWFRVVSAIVFLALLWTAHRFRVRHLKEQEKKFREMVESIPAVAFVTEADGNRAFWNRRWVEYTGATVDQSLQDGWQQAVHPDELTRVLDKWRTAVATVEPLDYEARFRGSDGVYRWFQVRATPLRDDGGKVTKWCGVATDIEDRKRAEELQSELAHMDRVTVLGELAASISHELKQPLTASMINARTSLRWLRADEPNLQEAREAIERIVQDGGRATEIIDRLRALYTKTPVSREPVNVNNVAREMTMLLRDEANRYAVSIRTDLASTLPDIIADRVQLQQVLMNLMLNGIEAMNETGGVLTIMSARDDGRVQISVSDTGVGLPAESVDRMFDAFVTTKPHGSGMGLSISRTIIESHGGRIWATGNDGRGATFHFSLPIAAEATAMVGSTT
jgi:PAS domain S-box-containing protein